MKIILLSNRDECFVDDDDYDVLSKFSWYRHDIGLSSYVERHIYKNKRRTSLSMHRQIMNPSDNMLVDHIDGNGLNNQKENLRICSHQENCMNMWRSKNSQNGKYKGVCYRKSSNRWRAIIYFNGTQKELGTFINPKDAARVYDDMARELHGEFAVTNETLGLL